MAKRELPLFIFDLSRNHNFGECDFVACTDIDNAFVAKIDYARNATKIISDNIRITRNNGDIYLRLEILRITGKNPDQAKIRTLLKKAESLYVEQTQKEMDVTDPSTADMIHFLNVLISGNKKNIAEAGADFEQRQTVITSLQMLDAIRKKLQQLEE